MEEVARRYTVRAGAWRNVEGIIWDKNVKKQLNGKVLEACMVPACVHGSGTPALTEKQEGGEAAGSRGRMGSKNK